MKKIILLTTLVAFVSVGAFAQKESFKKNTFSENIGLLSPVGDWAEDFYESGVSLKLSYSRNCTKDCVLEVNHQGEHLCKNPLEKHFCKGKCNLKEKSKECKEDCSEIPCHEGNHKCS
ncbi:MAG: hypothetical protein J6X18_04035, partial [Bacteroidales bacterium]|nr:hypothetical protein [Bacteroidales bacterium]